MMPTSDHTTPDPATIPPEGTWMGRLSRVRHDLRNPLSEILGFSEILQEEAEGSGLGELRPGFAEIQQVASRIFSEVNHWLNPDSLRLKPDCLQELQVTVDTLAQRIIATAESLSGRCDELGNTTVGDDLIRITGSARRLRELAPKLLPELVASLARQGADTATGDGPCMEGGTDFVRSRSREVDAGAGGASGSLLIVDDNEANRALLARRLRRQGYTVSLAENGRQALEKLRARRYDLVLLDVIMPEMGGYHVLEKIKDDPMLRHTPVIMISALDDLEMLARCIQKGAEDYLSKPFDPVLLRARIGSSMEKKRLHDQEQRTYRALVESQERLAAELSEAAAYVTSLLPAPLSGEVQADWRYVPSSQLGGDAFGYHWIDEDYFAVYLLDVCSHGIGAALLSISVMNVLRSQTIGSADPGHPGDVLAALNRMFPMENHNNLYFTVWYGVFQKSTRRLSYATGGHPPAILVTGSERGQSRVEALKAPGPPVGTFPECRYPVSTTQLERFNRLYVFSDGAYEIVRPDGSMLTLEAFAEHLADHVRRGGGGLDLTFGFLRGTRGSDSFEDDLALIELSFP